MLKSLRIIAVVVFAALWPAAVASAQFGFGIHVGGGRYHDHDPHFDHHEYYGHQHHHSDWHHVVPHYDRHWDGSYYWDDGNYYYAPQPRVTDRGAYVPAKPVAIKFGSYARIDDLTARMERLANDLCLDLHYNYRHNRGFAATYREAYEILETAKYIHDKEHQGDRAEVARRLDQLDGLFHHVQDDVQGWSRRNVRQIGQSGARAKLDLIESTLHHLMHTVGVKGIHGDPHTAPAPADYEVAPTPAD
jgi:hypothetical protein